jgi:hypothetical protein
VFSTQSLRVATSPKACHDELGKLCKKVHIIIVVHTQSCAKLLIKLMFEDYNNGRSVGGDGRWVVTMQFMGDDFVPCHTLNDANNF